MTPTKLMFWNSNDDDGRGDGFVEGYYRTKEAAEAEAERRNVLQLASVNRQMQLRHDRSQATSQRQIAEHNALFAAGLVPGPAEVFEPKPFIPKTKLFIFSYPEKNPTERNSRWGTEDHYYTEEIEFDG